MKHHSGRSRSWAQVAEIACRIGSITDLKSGRHWSAAHLREAIESRAAGLRAAGVEYGAPVLLVYGGCAEFFIDLLAVWIAGGTAACLNSSATAFEVETVTGFLQPSFVLSHPNQTLTSTGVADRKRPEADAPPLLVLFTSGTTSAPKAVGIGETALLCRIEFNRQQIGDAVLRNTLLTLPTHFGHGLIGNSLTALLAGHHLVIPIAGLTLARTLNAIIDTHAISFMSSVPSFWQLVVSHTPPPEKKSLQRIHIGSAPLSVDLWQKIGNWSGCTVWNCYGTTEMCNWVSGASLDQQQGEPGFVGKPWGVEAAVLTEDGVIESHGRGELLLRGPTMMDGYLYRGDLTAQVMHDGWYRSGDHGHIDTQGHLRLVGRLKEDINRGGLKIHPNDVDILVSAHPAVEQACAFGIPNAVTNEVVGIAVKLSDPNVSTKQIVEWMQGRIFKEAIPDKWYVVDEMPLTDNGKVSRVHVRRILTGV